MQNYVILCLIFLFIQLGYTQTTCNQHFIENLEQAKNPTYLDELAAYHAEIPRLETTEHIERAVITIPVVVHVIHKGSGVGTAQNISDSRIKTQIDVLNADFRRLNTDANQTPSSFQGVAVDTEIEFCLAKVDANGNPTSGITRHLYSSIPNVSFIEETVKPQTTWNSKRYLNLWSVPTPEKENFILGYAYLPTQSIVGTYLDGVVIVFDRFGIVGNSKGRTATHEMGHYLGLQHIFGGGQSGGCDTDDGIADTPNAGSPYFGCPSFPKSSCGSSDMFMNYMDYVTDDCMNLFTAGQANVMQSVLTSVRGELINNAGTACNIDVSVDESELGRSVQLFPNPASDLIHLELPNDKQVKAVALHSANGNTQYLMNYQANERIMNISNMESGVYFVAIDFGTAVIWKKIVIVHQ